MARIAVLGSLPESLVNFRGPMLAAMRAAGHEVHGVGPSAKASTMAELNSLGVQFHEVPLNRASLNPIGDLNTIWALLALFRRLRPDHVLAYTIKPVIYGGIAARMARVPHYHAMITGLGYTLSGVDLRGRMIAPLVRALYRQSLAYAEKVFFQNPDNLAAFQEGGLLRDVNQAIMIAGSGVDLDKFYRAPLYRRPDFLMIARLLRDKGVMEYVEAARIVKRKHPEARFRLVGWIDANPMAISPVQLQEWVDEGIIEYLGRLDDVRIALADAAVYCLPSYHEGMPRTALEAMAMGRPVITTDVPGCRETVCDGENGFLVTAGNAQALADAMLRFVDDLDIIFSMGAASRRRAEQHYDVHSVNRVILNAMGLLHEAII